MTSLQWKENSGQQMEAMIPKRVKELRSKSKFTRKYAIRKVQDNRQEVELNGLHQLLVYADDVNMLGENPQWIRENTEILLVASKEIGLEVNPEKTKYMIMSRDQNIVRNGNINIGDLSFEEVERFKYLGATGNWIHHTQKKETVMEKEDFTLQMIVCREKFSSYGKNALKHSIDLEERQKWVDKFKGPSNLMMVQDDVGVEKYFVARFQTVLNYYRLIWVM
ncbi:hypothetical protein ANN_22688 [Periplaneta americana]|uniref:Reverse transcriptase domain-containing protein n=1 Tax=Periplaneta americana TaxID=6978 RepID=A0ABQ8S952_PERAM|nr:hypothetical protein ANN_22688 [Periplaneta americana]